VSPGRRVIQRRGERVAPLSPSPEWELRFATNEAAEGWEDLCRQAPGPTKSCWQQLRPDPLRRDRRQHPLHDKLSHRTVGGQQLEQWQKEVTGAGRVWYCPDPKSRTIWMTDASIGHPKATE
jgi:hypothetical protein